VAFVAAVDGQQRGAAAASQAPAGPRITFDTPKGTFEIVLYQAEAPRSVAHILSLAKRNFYRGQRIHRVEASLVQFGDQTSRDMSRREWWGRASSGNPIGVAEFNKYTHVRGAVSLAHAGNPAGADSQLFIMKTASSGLNGKHVVIGRVVRGMEIVDKLQVTDLLKQVTVVEP
jgi:cyclophilin family peptidyl-prolyl cis-trans isomerase